MGRRDGFCACGLVACICFRLAGEVIESAHPHHDERPSRVVAVQVSPRHPDHTHEEHVAFVNLEEDRSSLGSGGNVEITPPAATLRIDTAAPAVL